MVNSGTVKETKMPENTPTFDKLSHDIFSRNCRVGLNAGGEKSCDPLTVAIEHFAIYQRKDDNLL